MIDKVNEAKELFREGKKSSLTDAQYEKLYEAFLTELPSVEDIDAVKEISLLSVEEKKILIDLLSNKYTSKL